MEAAVDDSASRTGSDTGNIVVRIPGNSPGPTVMLCAHMDTIASTEGMVPVLQRRRDLQQRQDGPRGGRQGGTCDPAERPCGSAGRGLPHPDIEVLFTVQEEVGLVGAKHLGAELKASFGYILDGDGPVGNIINQTPSKVDLDLVLEGKAAHAGVRPEEGSMPSSLRPRPSPAFAPDASTPGRLRMWA